MATQFIAGAAPCCSPNASPSGASSTDMPTCSQTTSSACLRGRSLLDCLEFDDHLRYVDGIDDAAFLAMDLEFLGRKDLGDYFLDEYCRRADDAAPHALRDFYIAYRAVVRAKVDCIRVTQGHRDGVTDACRHIDIALDHLTAAPSDSSSSVAVRAPARRRCPGPWHKRLEHRSFRPTTYAENCSIPVQSPDLSASSTPACIHPRTFHAVYDEVLRRACICPLGRFLGDSRRYLARCPPAWTGPSAGR